MVEVAPPYDVAEITALAASERSATRPYGEAARWRLLSSLPDHIASMKVAHVADELPCRVVFSALDAATARVDPAAMRQVLLNLFDNAVKYGPPGQVVRVTVVRRGAHVREDSRRVQEHRQPGDPVVMLFVAQDDVAKQFGAVFRSGLTLHHLAHARVQRLH